MTAASSPPPRDGEVCPHGWRDARCGRFGDVGPCGCVRPAAPSEPPAADSPTPGTDDESAAQRSERTGECICTSSERMRGRPFPECGAHQQPDSRLRAAAPSPVDTTEPPALPMSEAHKQALRDQVLNARVVFHPEPPAETQQDDERDEDGLTATDRMVARLIWDGFRSQLTDKEIARGAMDGFEPRTMAQQIVAALAARPSADNVAAALRRGHGPRCQEPDEEGPGTCVCEQRDLARLLAARPSADAERLREVERLLLVERDARDRDQAALQRIRELADEYDRNGYHQRARKIRAALDAR